MNAYISQIQLQELLKSLSETYIILSIRYSIYRVNNTPIQIVEDLMNTWDTDNWKLAQSILDNYENSSST